MFERFTEQARAVVVGAHAHARRLGHDFIGCEHLLLAAAESPTPAGEVLRELGISTSAIESTLLRRTGTDPFEHIDKDALAAIGIDLDRVRASVEDSLGPLTPDGSGATEGNPDHPGSGPHSRRGLRRRGSGKLRTPFTKRAKACLEQSLREAVASRDSHLGVEHVVLALTAVDSATVRRTLSEAGVTGDAVRTAIRQRYRRAG
jgi:hypothetical protein